MIAKIRYKPTKCLATFWADDSLHDMEEKRRMNIQPFLSIVNYDADTVEELKKYYGAGSPCRNNFSIL